MPIYDYECSKCGDKFDALIRSESEEASLRCPKCNAAKPARQLSIPAAPRAAASRSLNPAPRGGGGCGRCGDPQGPCGIG